MTQRVGRKCVCCDEPSYGESAWCAIHAIAARSKHAPPRESVDSVALDACLRRVAVAEQAARDSWEWKQEKL